MTTVEHINPKGLSRNPAFSQAVCVTEPQKFIYIGGQNAVDASGKVIGLGDLRVQAQQIFNNLKLVLEAGGARLENVVKWTICVVQGQSLRPALEVFGQEWNGRPNPPAISVMYVAGLANPDFLAEIEAVAVVPANSQSLEGQS
jgi:enamine deaminase RidA (YjgF/YER057c/UK114 family)